MVGDSEVLPWKLLASCKDLFLLAQAISLGSVCELKAELASKNAEIVGFVNEGGDLEARDHQLPFPTKKTGQALDQPPFDKASTLSQVRFIHGSS